METEKPQSGSAIERAKEYGIDLTLNQSNLKMTPYERLQQLQSFARFVEKVRESQAVYRTSKTND
ncbi:MAG: hypothetical protein HYZ34_14810 [Ignavibacteriae bacterium]|nr:hypothetical protein [Ignavibacteriota bacterium]